MNWALAIIALALIVVLSKSQVLLPKPATVSSPEQIYKAYIPFVSMPQSLSRGIAMANPNCQDLTDMGATWQYTWGNDPVICPGKESVPMLWGRNQVGAMVGGNSQYLLEFNEPNFSDQSNLTQLECAQLIWQIENDPQYAGYKLVSPAIGDGRYEWLIGLRNTFIDLYGRPPRWDVIAFHYYVLNDSWFKIGKEKLDQYVLLAEEWGAELWVTEFAVVPLAPITPNYTHEQALTKLDEWMAYMKPKALRYAYFTNRINGSMEVGCAWLNGCSKFALFDFTTGTMTQYGLRYRH